MFTIDESDLSDLIQKMPSGALIARGKSNYMASKFLKHRLPYLLKAKIAGHCQTTGNLQF